SLLDLFQPGLQPRLVLLAEQNLSDLLLDADEPVALQRVLRLQPEDVIAERRAVGRRYLSGLELQDLALDVLRELTALERAEVAPIFGAGVLGVLARDGGEVSGLQRLRAQDVGLDPRALPGRVVAAVRDDEDVPRVIGQTRLELRPVFFEILHDLRIGHGHAQRHLAPNDLLYAQALAHALAHRLHGDALVLEQLLEFLDRLRVVELDPLGDLLRNLL